MIPLRLRAESAYPCYTSVTKPEERDSDNCFLHPPALFQWVLTTRESFAAAPKRTPRSAEASGLAEPG
jgi:hypothetical protein